MSLHRPRPAGALACALVCLPLAGAAQELAFDVLDYRTIQIADNRRNDGNMGPIAMGDVDGDGTSDVVMGSPRAGGFLSVDTGVVYVRFGANYLGLYPRQDQGTYFDLTASPDAVTDPTDSTVEFPTVLPPLLQGPTLSGVQINAEEFGGFFGSAVATGDFDGTSGGAWIAASATYPLLNDTPGSVYLIEGGPSLQGIVDLRTLIFDGKAFEITGREDGSRFGESLLMKDLDGDGKDDLVIGTPRSGLGGIVDVVWGRTSLSFDRIQIDSLPAPHTRISTSVAGEMAGFALEAGQLDGAAGLELAVGAPAFPTPASSAGRVAIVRMGTSRPPFLNLGSASYIDFRSTRNGDRAGAALAIGDYDTDTVEDLAIGAPDSASDAGISQAGRVYLVSNPNRFASSAVTLPASADTEIKGVLAGEQFGYSLAFVDYDRAPGIDLAVGAPGEIFSALPSVTGAVWLYRGGQLPKGAGSGHFTRHTTGYFTTEFFVQIGSFRLGEHVAGGNFDGANEDDIFFSGTGEVPFASSCDQDGASWQTCHDDRSGRRVFGVIAGSIPQPGIPLSANPGWSELE